MNRIHYTVSGLQNEAIKTQVKNVLTDLKGVQMVNVDLARSTIEVGYNPPAETAFIKREIEKTGCHIEE